MYRVCYDTFSYMLQGQAKPLIPKDIQHMRYQPSCLHGLPYCERIVNLHLFITASTYNDYISTAYTRRGVHRHFSPHSFRGSEPHLFATATSIFQLIVLIPSLKRSGLLLTPVTCKETSEIIKLPLGRTIL